MHSSETITITEATAIQHELRQKLEIKPFNKPIKTIAGADISFNKFSTTVYAGIVVLSFPDLKPLYHSLVKVEVHFPYVPGYLAFREVPALLQAWEKLPEKPDILVVDGHGISHPRGMGIAAHFGALTGQPSMGCAKKILFGKYEEPDETIGSFKPIVNRSAETIGWTLRTKYKVKPVFVSPGNLIGMEQSRELLLQCVGKYRLPEPTRLAHETVNAFRKGLLEEGFTKF